MDYELFIKSKKIAEKWGEVQATGHDANFYLAALTEFYDYIQALEAEIFNQEISSPVPLENKGLELPVQLPKLEELKVVDDEDDPWFGFSQ